jgi:hypothetical protein
MTNVLKLAALCIVLVSLAQADTVDVTAPVSPPVAARAANFPTDRTSFASWMSGVTSAVADAGILAREIPQPVIVYEVSQPVDIEGQLMDAAVRDATKRIALVAKSLDRRLNRVRTAYFPTTVSVGGKRVEISDALKRLEGDAINVPVTYTIQISYALEE